MSFFNDAPMFTWLDYIAMQYNPFQDFKTPSILPESPTMSSLNLPKTQYRLSSTMFQYCQQYQTFLEKYFRSSHHDFRLYIPASIISQNIKSGLWKGVELRNKENNIIGLVFSKYMGCEPSTKIHSGMIDYLCIHPSYRKQGLVNILLRALYVFCAPKYKVHFFRKEGFPLAYPPIQSTYFLCRKKRNFAPHASIQKVSYSQSLQTIFQNTLGKDALYFQDNQSPSSLEIYKYNQDNPIYLALIPTYELSPQNESCCELLVWGCEKPCSSIALSYGIEAIIDQLPYDIFFAPQHIPHQEFLGWKPQGTIGLYGFHFHPGSPASRPLFSSLTF